MTRISPQEPADAPAIEELLDLCFGVQRHARPSYRLRLGGAPLDELAFVLRDREAVVGTIRFWPVTAGNRVPALLLGPLAVHFDYRGQGFANDLIARGLAAARRHGHRVAVAIGDPARFARFGFAAAAARGLAMPAPVDEERFLVAALEPGALAGISGVLAAAPKPAAFDGAAAAAVSV
jgi:predicted N-acetyltransferase YhbS